MAKCAKCGGAHKMKYGGKVMPKYSNDPRTEQGRVLKYGGSCGSRVIKGSSLRRQRS